MRNPQKKSLCDIIFCMLAALMLTICISGVMRPAQYGIQLIQTVYAGADEGVLTIPVELEGDVSDVQEIYDIVSIICQAIGVIFGLVGLVQYIISHTNDSGAEMHQGIMMIAIGIVLVLIPAVLSAVEFADVIAGGATTPTT